MFEVFSYIDAVVLIVYFILILSLGFYYSQKNDDNYEKYFLAGKNIPWFIVGVSIFATNISSEHFIGLAGAGSLRGLAVGQFELMAIFTLLFLGWFLIPIYFKTGVVTVPEFLEKVFDRRIRKFFALFSIIIYIFTKVLVSLFAAGLLFYDLFGLNIYASSILLVLITGLYSVIGGSSAVIKTQYFQGLILMIGAFILSIAGFNAVGGFEGLTSKVPDDFFNMFKSATDPDYPWTGIIFGAPIIAFWYWCTDQYIVQRLLSARSIDQARKGSLLAASLKILPIFILVFPGIFASILFPESRGDSAYSAMIYSDIVPHGLKGFVIAGLLAAIMSSLAGVFNTISVLFTNDFYKLRHPDANERKLILVGRLSTTAAVVGAILIVPLVKVITSQIYLFLQSVQSFVSPPITAVFLFGLFSKKMSPNTAIITLIIGEAIGILRLVLQLISDNGVVLHPILAGILGINFLHFSILLFLLSILIIQVGNAFSTADKTQIVSVINSSMKESLSEIRLNFGRIGHLKSLNSNFAISMVIVFVIIILWTFWN
ncbi:MAG: sodium/solute symporter [Ignavibacteria bacterium]|jgi:SSS family solute:Na+ symporter|nr:sodium/solute symporter [Ignavibacteria bacterium]MDH7526558.1 sodium/solute symporter [Ignavibacteria bacterium]